MKQLKAIKKSDNVTIIFGEWFDKTYGNTYYDAEVYIGDKVYQVPYQYGYNAPDHQAINESLASIGYRVRIYKNDGYKAYKNIHARCINKLKRELFKETA